MALIKCPECGNEVSDKAEICPHCGIKIAGNIELTNVNEPVAQPANNATAQANTQQPTTPPKGGKGKKVMLISFVIALAVVGTGYYFYNDAQAAKEEEDYEYALSSDDPLVLQSYLTRYGNAPQEHRDSINARLSLLSQEDTDWANAVISGTKNALEEYIRNNPNSPHRGEASNKIDSIDFAIATRGNSVDAYRLYLQQHPDGKYAGQAQDYIDDKKQTEVTPDEEVMAKNTFRKFFQAINSRDEGKLLETVDDYLRKFLNKDDVTSSTVVTFMNKLYKEDVKNLNWHILDGTKVEKVKNSDDTYTLRVTFPAELKYDRTDPTKEKDVKYIIDGEVTSEGRITKFTMKKIEQ